MSHSRVITACVEGSEVLEVIVEVDIQPGLPFFTIIGLPDKRIDEARERVKAAIKNSGLQFPSGKITVNLAPSSIRKRGTGFDLAIAYGIHGQQSGDVWVLGELGLQGEVRACPHLVSILLAAKQRGVRCIIPQVQQELGDLVGGEYRTVSVLKPGKESAWKKGGGKYSVSVVAPEEYLLDTVVGQEQAKRALLISLAGNHNLVFTGPPGVGKTVLVQAAAELLPSLEREELLDVLQLYAFANQSVVGRPFRSPSHTISYAGMFGGGTVLKPGEVSLAHRGILFLDELPLYSREVLNGFREVLSNKVAVHNRSGKQHAFPADCLVIAARNPCWCGRTGIQGQECLCSAADRIRYSARVSEAFLDRCELFCDVPLMEASEWKSPHAKQGAEYAMLIQKVRGNAGEVAWPSRSEKVLAKGITTFSLSGRGRGSVRSVSETIAKLAMRNEVEEGDVHEALQYRRKPFF